METLAALQRQVVAEALQEVRAAWWLQSPYASELLLATFPGQPSVELSFNIELANGLNLASPQATPLRTEIFDFFCLQAHPAAFGTRNRAALTDKRHLLRAARIVDHFLLQDSGKFATHGFAAISNKDLSRLLLDAAQSNFTAAGLYGWHARLTVYLKAKGAAMAWRDVQDAIDCAPGLADTDEVEGASLALSEDELVRARAYMYWETIALVGSPAWAPRHNEAANGLLKRALYRNTLLGPANQLVGLRLPPDLLWSGGRRTLRELPGVPTAEGRESSLCSESKIREYQQCIGAAQLLSDVGLGFSSSVLAEFKKLDIREAVVLKRDLGFSHVPPPIIAEILRKAVVFFYHHSEHLLASLQSVLLGNAKRQRIPAEQHQLDVEGHLHPNTKALGVDCWAISHGPGYASALRGDAPGLWDLVTALYGACAIIVGACEAARQGELLDIAKDDLDDTKTWLALQTRKSGFGESRYEDFRPIPRVAAEVIERLGALLIAVGADTDRVFATLTRTGGFRADVVGLNQAIDLFLDYIRAPTDAEGRRYYIRQHQLRKFFASVFFHCCGFAGMGSLRWFLRHHDLKHLWAYIRGTTPGSLMRHHMATAATLLIRDGAREMDRLAAVVRHHFHVDDLSIVSDDEIEELVEHLQESGRAIFKPVFASHQGDRPVRLGVAVWDEL